MRFGLLVMIGLALGGCAPTVTTPAQSATDGATSRRQSTSNAAAYSMQIKDTESSQLCSSYNSTAPSEQSRLMIEAELAVRGVFQCGGKSIGERSAAMVGRASYGRDGIEIGFRGRDYDCSDFDSGAAAQRFFLASGGPIVDPHNLDRDGDGMACEWGAQIRQIASRRVSAPLPIATARPRYTRSGCYVGPRGGTYTITSSGAKNYGGC